MRIAHVKRKSVNVMETAMNAENIMQSLNVRDLVKKVKRKHEWLHDQKTVNKWSLKILMVHSTEQQRDKLRNWEI